MKKVLLSIMGIALFGTAVYAETFMRVNITDGQVDKYDMEKVAEVYFGEEETVADSLEGKIGNYRYVDLGLPSGLKWAAYNVGAKAAEDHGYYFAWGETEPKNPTNKNSVWKGVSVANLTAKGVIDGGRLTVNYDAATVNWGSSWRMPTSAEFDELLKKCTWAWTTLNNVGGYKVTGPSGKFIFFPAVSCCNAETGIFVGVNGYYWSANVREDNKDNDSAWFLKMISPSSRSIDRGGRSYGYPIRPVSE